MKWFSPSRSIYPPAERRFVGYVALALFVATVGGGVLIWRTMPEPHLSDAFWLSGGSAGVLGVLVLAVRKVLGIGTDLGPISITRCSWAAERAFLALALFGVALIGFAVADTYHVPDRTLEPVLYAVGVSLVLALTLGAFGQPWFLLPADIRKQGPRTIWAPLRESRWGEIFATAFRRDPKKPDLD